MSPSASPANDCPRITVKTPTTPVTIATAAPITSAMWTASLSQKPGAKTKNAALTVTTRRPSDFSGRIWPSRSEASAGSSCSTVSSQP